MVNLSMSSQLQLSDMEHSRSTRAEEGWGKGRWRPKGSTSDARSLQLGRNDILGTSFDLSHSATVPI